MWAIDGAWRDLTIGKGAMKQVARDNMMPTRNRFDLEIRQTQNQQCHMSEKKVRNV